MLVEPGTNQMIFVNKAAKELEIKADGRMNWSFEMGKEAVNYHPLE